MINGPSFDDIVAVISAASVGNPAARVLVPDHSSLDHMPTRLALALNVLLDDLSFRTKSAERLADRLSLLAEASHEFSSAMQSQERLVAAVARRLGAVAKDCCAVLLASEDDDRGRFLAAVQAPDDEADRVLREIFSEPFLRAGYSIARQVDESGKPFLSEEIDNETLSSQLTPKCSALLKSIGIHSLLILPLRAEERSLGQVVLARYRPSSRPFDEDDLGFASEIAARASLADRECSLP